MKYGLSYTVKKINSAFAKKVMNTNWQQTLYKDTDLIEPEETPDLPKISIIMPSYNQAEFIERSLLSIINQNYKNYELIVMDGGSTDNTTEILKKYDKFIAYWISEKDNGQSDALNKGFEKATGDVYCWMNSDDIFLPDVFHAASVYFKKNYSVVFGDVGVLDIQDKIVNYQIAFPFTTNQFIYDGFVHNSQAMFWSSKLHEAFGSFREELYYTMDYDFIVRLCMLHAPSKWKFIPKPIGAFRIYEGQKTGEAHEKAMLEHRKIAERLGFMDKFSDKGKKLKWKYYANRHLWFFVRYFRMLIRIE